MRVRTGATGPAVSDGRLTGRPTFPGDAWTSKSAAARAGGRCRAAASRRLTMSGVLAVDLDAPDHE